MLAAGRKTKFLLADAFQHTRNACLVNEEVMFITTSYAEFRDHDVQGLIRDYHVAEIAGSENLCAHASSILYLRHFQEVLRFFFFMAAVSASPHPLQTSSR